MDNNKDLSRTDRTPAVADAREVAPPVDIYENADEIWVVADLPACKVIRSTFTSTRPS